MKNRELEIHAQAAALQDKVTELEKALHQVRLSNTNLRDDFAEFKQNYSNLVDGLNNRFQFFEQTIKTFRK